MTTGEFAQRAQAMMGALHRVSYALVPTAQDREDAVQQALEKAFRKRQSLRDEQYFQTWVVRILINECHNITRHQKRFAPLHELADRAAPPDANSALHDAVLALPEPLRLPVVLHYMQGYPVCEVARMLRLPEGTVKSRMTKARGQLRELLSEEEGLQP